MKKRVAAVSMVALLAAVPAAVSAADAAGIPEGAIVNPVTANAFHESQIGLTLTSLEILDALNDRKPVYFNLPGAGMFVDITSGNVVSQTQIDRLPDINYTDENGKTTVITSDFKVTEIE